MGVSGVETWRSGRRTGLNAFSAGQSYKRAKFKLKKGLRVMVDSTDPSMEGETGPEDMGGSEPCGCGVSDNQSVELDRDWEVVQPGDSLGDRNDEWHDAAPDLPSRCHPSLLLRACQALASAVKNGKDEQPSQCTAFGASRLLCDSSSANLFIGGLVLAGVIAAICSLGPLHCQTAELTNAMPRARCASEVPLNLKAPVHQTGEEWPI